MVEINRNAFRDAGLEFVLGTGRFVAPRRLAVKTNDGSLRIIEGEHAFINTGTTAAIPDVPGLKAAAPLTHFEALVRQCVKTRTSPRQ
jgi:pyruvate/2-oxoglutarate dehydrogenase complex dihydrolipoamide dehydrogenase (E3) component